METESIRTFKEQMKKERLIIFAKNPIAGRVKNRLAKQIGSQLACEVYRSLVVSLKNEIIAIPQDILVSIQSELELDRIWTESRFRKRVQVQGNLGRKMEAEFRNSFIDGYDSVCLMGSDIYNFNRDILKTAFSELENNDAVIGPSVDGGYYLIGFSKNALDYSTVFEEISWSSSTVLEHTLARLNQLNFKFATLSTLRDIDREEDLPKDFLLKMQR